MAKLNNIIFNNQKSPDGIKAKLSCIYRRADISQTLLSVFEREYHSYYECLSKQLAELFPLTTGTATSNGANEATNKNLASPTTSQQSSISLAQFLRQREVFFSEDIETNVPVECFRGKASVKLFMPGIDTVADFLGNSSISNTFKNNKNNNNKSPRKARKTPMNSGKVGSTSESIVSSKRLYSDNISEDDKYFYLGKYNAFDKSVECAHIEISDEYHQIWEKELVSYTSCSNFKLLVLLNEVILKV